MFAKINSLGLFGLNAFNVDVEIEISRGIPAFDIVGLPDLVVKESRERIKASMRCCNIEFPVAKVMVNLAPAGTRKSGSVHDIAILVAVLKAAGYIKENLDSCCFIGELSLNGTLRPIEGVLPMVLLARETGFKSVFVPKDNAFEASVAEGIDIYAAESVSQILDHFTMRTRIEKQPKFIPENKPENYTFDFSDVKGQKTAKAALEIAAAGGHNALLIGTPGSGKSMLAKRMPSILPEMTFEESIETTKIHSISGLLDPKSPLVTERPFRTPHHTISAAGLAGGGSIPKPGEISLAHNGLLFLDELAEFDRKTLEILRQPLEDGKVTISRAAGTVVYPASIMLIAAMNPCPCGYYPDMNKCRCTPGEVSHYLHKLSQPLLERIDLCADVPPVNFSQISGEKSGESSALIRKRVEKARRIQQKRYQNEKICFNGELSGKQIRKYCVLTENAIQVAKNAFELMELSARSYHRILKVSRTIADMEGEELIHTRHVAEALTYKAFDKKYRS